MSLLLSMFKKALLLLYCIRDLISMIFKYLGTFLLSRKKLQAQYLMRNQIAEENSLRNSATSFSLGKLCFSLLKHRELNYFQNYPTDWFKNIRIIFFRTGQTKEQKMEEQQL